MNAVALMHRPCGACGALVSVRDGCEHWNPARPAGTRSHANSSDERKAKKLQHKRNQRERRRREQQEVIESFRRMMNPDGIPVRLGPGGRPVTG